MYTTTPPHLYITHASTIDANLFYKSNLKKYVLVRPGEIRREVP